MPLHIYMLLGVVSTKVGVVQNFRRAQSARFCLQKSPPLTNPVSAPGYIHVSDYTHNVHAVPRLVIPSYYFHTFWSLQVAQERTLAH